MQRAHESFQNHPGIMKIVSPVRGTNPLNGPETWMQPCMLGPKKNGQMGIIDRGQTQMLLAAGLHHPSRQAIMSLFRYQMH